MWGFEDARKASKDALAKTHDAITKFELGGQFGYDDWIRSAYMELCTRHEVLSIHEARRVGLEAANHISRIREMRLKSKGTAIPISGTVISGSGMSVHNRDGDAPLCCPHCSNPVKAEPLTSPTLFFSFGGPRQPDRIETCRNVTVYPCQTCKITLCGESTLGAERICKQTSDEVSKLVQPKLFGSCQ